MSEKKKKSTKKKTSKKAKSKPKTQNLMDFMNKPVKKSSKSKTQSATSKKKSTKSAKKPATKKPISIKDALPEEEKKVKKKPQPLEEEKIPEILTTEIKSAESVAEDRKKSKILKKSDLKFYEKDDTPFGEAVFKNIPEEVKREAQKSRYLKFLIENDQICNNMEQGLLLTVEYCGTQNKAYVKFYDLSDKKIKIWIDTTEHIPYLLSKQSKEELEQNIDLTEFEGYNKIESVKRFDLLHDEEIEVSKVYGFTPTDIAGGRDHNIKAILAEEESVEEEDSDRRKRLGSWESNIRYHLSYMYDLALIPGLLYSIKDGKLSQIKLDVEPEIEKAFMDAYKHEKPEFQEIARNYLKTFSYPIPDVRRVAFDIEVDVPVNGQLPNTKTAKQAIISVSFSGSDGFNKVYTLYDKEKAIGEMPEDFPKDAEILFFEKEKDLLIETFRILWDYPIVVSFNGDNFDFNYMFHRAARLKIPSELNPIQIARGGSGMVSSYAYLKSSVHLELYQVFANRSIKGYAFGGAYDRNSLDHISKALLHSQKIKHDSGSKAGEKFSADDIANLDHHTLAYYNMMDSILTLNLTQFGGNSVWNLIVYLMRITKLPMQDLIRHQISFWIRNLMFFEHRTRNYIIPRRSEIQKEKPGGIGKSIIEGKGFQGAYVITPIPGIHFDVVVADFSSLYPSIIKSRNLSYETINCPHEECSSNFLPDTSYHVCTKRTGIFALVVGFLRDIRVKWFKPRSSDKNLSEEERSFAKILQAALKVFINGSYGVFGSPNFPLFCLPVAEATTTIGRYSIKETIDKANSMGVRVLYGDTDSVFLEHPTKKQIDKIIEWSTEHLKIDLEEEKTYQFLALSDRKKNYVGIYKGSQYVDIKGMTGKKSNTPPFIIKAFNDITIELKKISNMDDFNREKGIIEKKIKQSLKKIGRNPEKGGYTIEDYAITVGLKKNIDQYKKTMPQHVKAAKMAMQYSDGKIKYERGDVVEFVKTKDSEGVKPLSRAQITDVDIDKYKELLRSTFEQLLDALGMTFEELEGTKKLDMFFS